MVGGCFFLSIFILFGKSDFEQVLKSAIVIMLELIGVHGKLSVVLVGFRIE